MFRNLLGMQMQNADFLASHAILTTSYVTASTTTTTSIITPTRTTANTSRAKTTSAPAGIIAMTNTFRCTAIIACC